MTQTIPLSYLVRQRQLACAQVIADWFGDLALPVQKLGVKHWTRTDQRLAPDVADLDYNFSVIFDYSGFDNGVRSKSGIRVVSSDVLTLDDETLLLDNRIGTDALDVDLTRAVTFHQSRSESTANKLKLDIGVKTGTTIGGEAEGGAITAEISSTFGIETDTERIEAESNDRSQTVHVETKVPVGKALLATISTPNVVTEQDFTVHADIAGGFRIEMLAGSIVGQVGQLMSGPRYSGPGIHGDSGTHVIRFTGFDDFADALRGYNVDFPGLSTVDEQLSPEYIDKIMPKRRIDWEGTIRREAEKSAGYKFSAVSDDVADNKALTLPPSQVFDASSNPTTNKQGVMV